MPLRETPVPECHCPHCGALFTFATHLGDAAPSPGDGVVCSHCLRLSEVAADLTVKLVSDAALASFSVTELQETLDFLATLRIHVRRRQRF